jgi:hypothetical protein
MDLQHVAPHPDPPASPPAKFLEFLDSFAPAAGTEHAAMVTQAACYRTSTGHTC